MRVLVIRFSSLGDVVLATAAVRALTEDVPSAQVDILTKPLFREIFSGLPGVSEVLRWDPGEGLRVLARRIRAARYDWVVDLHGNLRSRLLGLLVRGPRWVRVRKGTLRRRTAVLLRRPSLLEDVHVVDRYIDALAPLGVAGKRRLPHIPLGEEGLDVARQALLRGGWDGKMALLALAPGARWPTKAWPRAHWRLLAEGIHRERLGFPVVLGGMEDRALGDEVLGEAPAVNLAGRTSILETAAVLAACDVLVTNDSAPLHIAGAVGTPVLALFGPTVRALGFHPLGPGDKVLEIDLGCRPCSLHGDDRCVRGHHRCLGEIAPDGVLSEVRRFVGENCDRAGSEHAPRFAAERPVSPGRAGSGS